MATLLDRDDVELLLRELAQRLHTVGITAGIRVIGGAAIALMNSDRRSTADIDAVPRDADDIEYLLDRCGVTSIQDAQEIDERYNTQEVLTDTAATRVQAWLDTR